MRKTRPKKPKSRRAPDVITSKRHWPRIIVIPDTQVRPGVPTKHLTAIGNYVAEKMPDTLVHLGDHADMPSLSQYEDKASGYWDVPERTYRADIDAANHGMKLLTAPIIAKQKRARSWTLRRRLALGNHEHRITRAVHADPALKGTLDLSMLDYGWWKVEPFLKPFELEGILFCHYFINQKSLKKGILGGTIDNRLNAIKQSFVMGHQQTRMWGSQWTSDGREIMGLVVGAAYLHDEEYMPQFQGNHYWRGVVVLNECRDGRYDPCFVSLDYLLRKYL